jgi:hypothetical protein
MADTERYPDDRSIADLSACSGVDLTQCRRCVMVADVKSLVNADQGLASRRIFIEPEIYE